MWKSGIVLALTTGLVESRIASLHRGDDWLNQKPEKNTYCDKPVSKGQGRTNDISFSLAHRTITFVRVLSFFLLLF